MSRFARVLSALALGAGLTVGGLGAGPAWAQTTDPVSGRGTGPGVIGDTTTAPTSASAPATASAPEAATGPTAVLGEQARAGGAGTYVCVPTTGGSSAATAGTAGGSGATTESGPTAVLGEQARAGGATAGAESATAGVGGATAGVGSATAGPAGAEACGPTAVLGEQARAVAPIVLPKTGGVGLAALAIPGLIFAGAGLRLRRRQA